MSEAFTAMRGIIFGLVRGLLTLGATAWVAGGCSRAPTLTVRNQSPVTISNVVVSGSGFSHRLGSLPPGGAHSLPIRPSGESGVRLIFDAGTNHVDSGAQGYFEPKGGYRITATVTTNLSVSVSDGSSRP